MYKLLILKKVVLKNFFKNGNGNGKIFKIKNIEFIIVKGIEVIFVVMIVWMILSCVIFFIGFIRYFCKKLNINYFFFLNIMFFYIVLYGYIVDFDWVKFFLNDIG